MYKKDLLNEIREFETIYKKFKQNCLENTEFIVSSCNVLKQFEILLNSFDNYCKGLDDRKIKCYYVGERDFYGDNTFLLVDYENKEYCIEYGKCRNAFKSYNSFYKNMNELKLDEKMFIFNGFKYNKDLYKIVNY